MAHGEQSVEFSKHRGFLKGLNIAMMSTLSEPIASVKKLFNEARDCFVIVGRKTPSKRDE
jgi:hypothetical protein